MCVCGGGGGGSVLSVVPGMFSISSGFSKHLLFKYLGFEVKEPFFRMLSL